MTTATGQMTSHMTSCVTLVVTLMTLASPVAAQFIGDAVVLEALPLSPLGPPESFNERLQGLSEGPSQRSSQEPQLRSSQGPEGFAYESSHPVLDAYGALATATQYHAQDGLGRYRYSFRQPGSSREEYVDENGDIQGSYSYDMPNEETISMTYYADDTGFHVKRAVLPNLAALAPRDEPEVAAIKAAHIRLWRSMWARAAAASVGAPLDPLELEPQYEPETLSLESDIVSSDPSEDQPSAPSGPSPDQPVQADPSQQQEEVEEEVVPIFPGGPDAPSVPVSSVPKPLASGAEGLTSPDSETVVVSAARIGDFGDFSASGGGRPQQQFPLLERVGALRLRGALPAAAFAVAASAPAATRITAPVFAPPQAYPRASFRPSLRASPEASLRASPEASPEESPEDSPDASSWLTRVGGSLPAPSVRVSDEAVRAGLLPVAARHSLAQVRPSQRRMEHETAEVLSDPVLYRYSELLHEARQQATPPRIVIV